MSLIKHLHVVQFDPVYLMNKRGKKCVLLPEGYFVHCSYRLSSHVFACSYYDAVEYQFAEFFKASG
jgi:hypothetical protein